jgi:hypothetical protein
MDQSHKQSPLWPISFVVSAAMIAFALYQVSERHRFTFVMPREEGTFPIVCDTRTGEYWVYVTPQTLPNSSAYFNHNSLAGTVSWTDAKIEKRPHSSP